MEQNEKAGFITHRGISEYAREFGMDRNELLSWLAEKDKILDISSGGAGLAQEVEILRAQGDFPYPTQIVSFDLAYSTQEGLDAVDYGTHLAVNRANVAPTRNLIAKTRMAARSNMAAGSFSNLPFRDESFDAILAANSFGIDVRDKQQLMSAYNEVTRVLKSGGDGFITVVRGGQQNGLRVRDSVHYTLGDIADLNPVLKTGNTGVRNSERLQTSYLYVKKK